MGNFKNEMLNSYKTTKIGTNVIKRNTTANSVIIHFISGPFVEITGNNDTTYRVEFIDSDSNKILHTSTIKNNMWTQASIKYYVNWVINIYENNTLILSHKYDDTDKNVYIAIDSNSLGDTLAWFPYIDEYRRTHNCKVICSTFWNKFFEKTYPDIKFVTPGVTVNNLYAQYILGIFGDGISEIDKNKRDTRNINLQEVATDILGLEFRELKPQIFVPNKFKPGVVPKVDYVAIAEHGTAQCKYWNNPSGWQQTVDYLNSIGLKAVPVSKEETHLTNVIDKTGKDKDIYDTIIQILGAKFFIGISSGLSWLAWALGVPTIVVSGHTKPFYEFQDNTYRVYRGDTCTGCWHENIFDKGDWTWCPNHKGTDRQFECTKSIKFEDMKIAIDVIRNDRSCYFEVNYNGEIHTKNLKKELRDFNWYDDEYVYDTNKCNNVIAYETYVDRDYVHGNCKVIEGDIVIDMGANIGIFSRFACEMGAKDVYSYEPEPINFECLKKNSMEYNIHPVNKAVSSKKDILNFNVKTASGIHTLSDIDITENSDEFREIIKVETTTFRDIISDNKIQRVNFLKIDVEGSERDIIYSMTKNDFDLVDKIAMEYHHRAFEMNEEMRENFIQYIVGMGFSNYYILHFRNDHCNMMYFWK